MDAGTISGPLLDENFHPVAGNFVHAKNCLLLSAGLTSMSYSLLRGNYVPHIVTTNKIPLSPLKIKATDFPSDQCMILLRTTVCSSLTEIIIMVNYCKNVLFVTFIREFPTSVHLLIPSLSSFPLSASKFVCGALWAKSNLHGPIITVLASGGMTAFPILIYHKANGTGIYHNTKFERELNFANDREKYNAFGCVLCQNVSFARHQCKQKRLVHIVFSTCYFDV